MRPQIRIDLENALQQSSPVILELGCGPKKAPGRIGIDRLDLPTVDIIADLEQGLVFLPDNSVDEIHSESVLEHIDDLESLMREIWRVLRPGGRHTLFVPHFSNPYYYSDPTHKRFFGLYTFEYFCKERGRFKRQVPAFYYDYAYQTSEIRLIFKSSWRSRNLVKKACQLLFNLSPWMMEFYEENLCNLIPCYGIEVTLRPLKEEPL